VANKSNAELWIEVKELRVGKADLEEAGKRLLEELEKKQLEIDRLAVHVEVLETELKSIRKDLSKAITPRRLMAEKQKSRRDGYAEGLGARK
jgi:hypothetical protein